MPQGVKKLVLSQQTLRRITGFAAFAVSLTDKCYDPDCNSCSDSDCCSLITCTCTCAIASYCLKC
jgi:hypothetical protein